MRACTERDSAGGINRRVRGVYRLLLNKTRGGSVIKQEETLRFPVWGEGEEWKVYDT